MAPREPISVLDTHEVTNQPPPLGDRNLYDDDPVIAAAVRREGAAWAEDRLRAFGALVGSERVMRLGEQANRFPPELRAFDPYGRRIDEVEFHPAYHELLAIGKRHEVDSVAWTAGRSGGHVVHAALAYLLIQAEAGVCCPLAMTYAALPVLRRQPELAAEWEPRILSREYDARFLPAGEKRGATVGMAMTEKQGGSDVRSNTTRAKPLDGGGPGAAYALTGHKWFCSAPMSDAFLTLAYAEGGLSCFFVPRWRPDGGRNAIFIQRLKDKLGNRSNASAEIEYRDAWAILVGEEGAGVKTIIDMVNHTRLDTALAGAGLMRQAVVQAVHHTSHRIAFQRVLSEQPLMANVLADLVLDWMAATMMVMRVARGYDDWATGADPFARVAVAVAKYWVNKRAPNHVYECMECLGGIGYVEESILPRLYREAPVNSIWEGSGNVICLDVLRAMSRDPDSIEAFLAELDEARGADPRLDRLIDGIRDGLGGGARPEAGMRRLVESMAVAWQAGLMARHAPTAIADAYLASRLDGTTGGWTYGTLPAATPFEDILALARPG